ncbi:MAG: hypothetical protein Q4A06_09300 [Cardiobacteriaceae bacterium]|nr:hypothetical protein [Cardiobacteriaceae bacterium]
MPFVAVDIGDPDIEFLATGRPFVGRGEVARGIVIAAVIEGDAAESAIKLAQAADIGDIDVCAGGVTLWRKGTVFSISLLSAAGGKYDRQWKWPWRASRVSSFCRDMG